MGPKPASTVLSQEEEAIAVAFRQPYPGCHSMIAATLYRLPLPNSPALRCTVCFKAMALADCPYLKMVKAGKEEI
jgi:hypothetical protein